MMLRKRISKFVFSGLLCSGLLPAFAESPGNFLNPHNSMPYSARASRGVAEQHTKSYRQDDIMSPSDRVQPKHANNSTQPPAPHPSTDTLAPQLNYEPATEAEDYAAEEFAAEKTTLLPTDWHNIGGIDWTVLYTGEVYNNMRGGISTVDATRYRGNTNIVMLYDTEANELWDGGEFFVYGSNTHGKTLSSEFVGDWQLYSNIDSAPRPNLMQVSEYWYMHKFRDGAFATKIGKCDANADFAYMDLASSFAHMSFSMSPNILMPTWPNQALGVVNIWQPREKLTLSLGVYDGAGDGRLWGFTTLGDNGAFLIGQAKWEPRFGSDGTLLGTYRAGVWGHTGAFDFVTDFDTTFVQTHGTYFTMEQLVWHEKCSEEQGLGLFSQLSVADGPSEFNVLNLHWSVGALYRGFFEGREEDIIGVGLTKVEFKNGTGSVTDYTYETAIETFYRYEITPWASIQPDLQYISNPGGTGNNRDAFVAGFRFQMSL
jgi:porin